MILTLEMLFKEPRLVQAIIDRTMQATQDQVIWKRYLTPHETKETTFTTFLGTTSQVVIGSMIDSHSKKPLRARRNLAKGTGTVGTFGDSFQMSEDRMDMLLELVNKFNATNGNDVVMNEIIDFLVDDYREMILAPMLAIDKMVGDARSRGKYMVNLDGGEYTEVVLPVNRVTATGTDLGSFVSWYRELIESEGDKGRTFKSAQMTSATFHNKVVKSKEFKDTFIMKFGNMDISPASVVTVDMANTLLAGANIDVPIEIVKERAMLPGNAPYKSFADNAICLLPQDNIGRLEFYKSIEWFDPKPNRTYSQSEGGAVLISTGRNDEGRFIEYQMNAAPNLSLPHKMTIVDVSATPQG